MISPRIALALVALSLLDGCSAAATGAESPAAAVAAGRVDVVNNQPFPIRMPLVVRGVKVPEGATAAQQVGDDAVVIVDAQASSTSRVAMQVPPNVRMRNRVELKAAENGISIAFDGEDLGRLAWGVVVKPIDPKGPRTEEKALDTKADFAAAFQPLALSFAKASEGAVYDTWRASGAASGLNTRTSRRRRKTSTPRSSAGGSSPRSRSGRPATTATSRRSPATRTPRSAMGRGGTCTCSAAWTGSTPLS
jgi:hypothetical protein